MGVALGVDPVESFIFMLLFIVCMIVFCGVIWHCVGRTSKAQSRKAGKMQSLKEIARYEHEMAKAEIARQMQMVRAQAAQQTNWQMNQQINQQAYRQQRPIGPVKKSPVQYSY